MGSTSGTPSCGTSHRPARPRHGRGERCGPHGGREVASHRAPGSGTFPGGVQGPGRAAPRPGRLQPPPRGRVSCPCQPHSAVGQRFPERPGFPRDPPGGERGGVMAAPGQRVSRGPPPFQGAQPLCCVRWWHGNPGPLCLTLHIVLTSLSFLKYGCIRTVAPEHQVRCLFLEPGGKISK